MMSPWIYQLLFYWHCSGDSLVSFVQTWERHPIEQAEIETKKHQEDYLIDPTAIYIIFNMLHCSLVMFDTHSGYLANYILGDFCYFYKILHHTVFTKHHPLFKNVWMRAFDCISSMVMKDSCIMYKKKLVFYLFRRVLWYKSKIQSLPGD